MLVTAGSGTKLLGETILVDDRDPTVLYEGDWSQSIQNRTRNLEGCIPVGGSTMQTSSLGASISFSFEGTSVSVFGVSEREDDFLSVDAYLDGNLVPKAPRSGNEFPHSNYPWFSASELPSGDHKIKLQLNPNNGSTVNFAFDYLTYTPSFPSVTTPPDSSIWKVNSAFGPSHTPDPNATKPSGARLAGLVFGIIGIVLLLALLIFRRRIFRRRLRPPAEPLPFALPGHRAAVAAKETAQRQQPQPQADGQPPVLRGILQNRSEPVRQVGALQLSLDAKRVITGKSKTTLFSLPEIDDHATSIKYHHPSHHPTKPISR
ncbi:hypothetical protein DXG01_013825 [Tephrocybe rancida]|nr:hypothetical protein DXG01_013825 [Tephrocybe rancida]